MAMMDWLSAFISSSSPVYLFAFLPFVISFWVKRYYLRVPIPHIADFRRKGASRSDKAVFAVWGLLVLALIITLVSPTIPTLKTVVVHSREVCERDIVGVYDISGSMQNSFKGNEKGPNKFDAALEALYAFAKKRSSDCFSTVVFSGPQGRGTNYPEKEQGYAFLANSFVKDPDELLLPLKDGIDKENPGSLLRQFSQGTEIGEGLIVADKFFKEESTAETKALMLISDLGNEAEDNERALETLNNMIDRGISVYVFGVDAYEDDEFYKNIRALGEAGKLHYFSIGSDEDLKKSYEIISRLEPSSEPHTRTEIVSVQRLNFMFLWAALAVWVSWFALEFRRTRIP
ncbi:MAG: vWA domain-containing protein, partial [Candidatus Spechtbacterales bacterium]